MRIPDASNGSYYWDNYAGVNTQLIIGDGRFDLPVLSPHTLNSATIDEDPSNDYYRYNFNTRVFKWKNIKLSNWIRPAFVKGYPIEIDVNNYVVVPQTLTFPEIINSGAHFIIRDGRLLSPDEYEIDPTNPRVVFLKQIAYDADAYLRDRIKAGVYNPLEYVREKFSNSQHYLVNISSTTTTPVKIMRTHSCMPNFPYKDEITFSDFSIYDTLLIDGKFIPTEWIHNNTVRIPMSVSNTLFKDRSVLSDADIYKLTFVDA